MKIIGDPVPYDPPRYRADGSEQFAEILWELPKKKGHSRKGPSKLRFRDESYFIERDERDEFSATLKAYAAAFSGE